jgi:YHS domain-containing protein
MVVDPVCKMSVDPAAALSLNFQGERLYFCSAGCRKKFLADPTAYGPAASARASDAAAQSCAGHGAGSRLRLNPAALGVVCGVGVLAAVALLGLYFGLLTSLSGWSYTSEQFRDYWPFITALAIGFGIQVGLFGYLRRVVHEAQSGKVVAVTGTTSGAAMVSCCTHYLVNLLPALGATGVVSLVGQYQVELFWVGLAANLAGITYMGRRIVAFAHAV